MKGIKFPKADKIIRKFTKNKKADLAVKVTPSGADRHPRFGSMHHTRCVISIEDSWDGYLFVTQEERMNIVECDGVCYVPIPDERFNLQSEFLDAKYMENRTLSKKVKEKFTDQLRRAKRRGTKITRDEEIARLKRESKKDDKIVRLERELKKSAEQIENQEKMIRVSKGSLVDAITLGILPPVVEPPFPLQHVSKLSRGPDALSIHSPKPGVLVLDFIEGNWTSKKGEPGMSPAQDIIRKLMENAEIQVRLWHHYQDGSGKWTWKQLSARRIKKRSTKVHG